MHTDIAFLVAAAGAIFIAGLSKSGFLTGVGAMSVPIMSLAISPVQAAAIMLPILIAQDVVSMWFYRNDFDRANLKILMPAAIVGVGIGWLTAAYVSAGAVRLIVGLIGLWFSLDYWLKLRPRQATERSVVAGSLWGTVAGFTSFVSHSGGPPFQIYMMPQRLPPMLFAGTSVMFFAAVNALKIVPYYLLGQFDWSNLSTSLMLVPFAPIGVVAGIWLVRRIPAAPFYRLAYALLLVVSAKLAWDGWWSIFGA